MSLVLVLFTLPANATTGAAEVSQDLWQALSEARHLVEESGSLEEGYPYRAYNPENRYNIHFGEQGLKLNSAGWEFAMTLTSYGQENNLRPVQKGQLSTDGNKVIFDRGSISEWYVNHTRGLEQGFTLEKPIGYSEASPVILSLSFSGELNPQLKAKGKSVAFYNEKSHAFDYENLKAFDSEGRDLAASLVLKDDGVQIHVDAEEAIWPITVDPVFSTETKLVGFVDDVQAGAQFGTQVAIDGNTALVSAVYEDGIRTNQGAVYVFVKSSTSGWAYQDRLTVGQQSFLGETIAISGDTAVIGMPSYEEIGIGTFGTVYIFERSGETWLQVRQIATPEPTDGGQFGFSVDVYGSDLVIGARYENSYGHPSRGNVYVYVKPIAGWAGLGAPATKLYASDGAANDHFGSSVSIEHGKVLVGAPGKDSGKGAAYVFQKDPSFGWIGPQTQDRAKLSNSAGTTADGFGSSIAIYDYSYTALIGTSGTEEAYIFYDGDGLWSDSSIPTAILTASDNVTGDQFGTEVALFSDTAVVGARYAGNTGAAYIFKKPATGGWATATETARLTASDADTSDSFGHDVAIGPDDVLVGARYDDYTDSSPSFNSGAVFIYKTPDDDWADSTEDQKLVASGFGGINAFGGSVSIDGDRALIGVPFDDTDNSAQGSAFIFDRENNVWTLQARLVASDGGGGDRLGQAVSLSGDKALIGATGQMAAYVFTLSGSEWIQTAKLQTSDPAVTFVFGKAVALLGDTAAIGAESDNPGMVYIFTNSGSAWSEQAKLTASDGDGLYNQFGESISLTEDTVLVGAPNSVRDGAGVVGAAYIFVKSGSSWSGTITETAKLLHANPPPSDSLGTTASLYGDAALLGADGAAYIFDKPIAGWSDMTAETAKLVPSDGSTNSLMYASLHGSTAVLGDYGNSTRAGAAYIFSRSGSQWYEVLKLTAADTYSYQNYGKAAALTGDTVLIGAPAFNVVADSGSAYIYRFDCGYAGPVIANRWTQVGLPCDVGVSDTVTDVFGDDLEVGDYRRTWVIYRYDQSTQRYARMELDSSLVHGEGYWLFSTSAGVWDTEGARTTYIESKACESLDGCFEIDLVEPLAGSTQSRFNMISNPGSQTINWADVKVIVDGIDYFLFEAADAGYITDTIWKYGGNSYESYNSHTPGMVGTIDSHEGFWVEVPVSAIGHDVRLLIPEIKVFGGPPGLPDPFVMEPTVNTFESQGWISKVLDFFIPSAHAAKPLWEQEWAMRLTVESPAENLRDRNNVLGQLMDSEVGMDSHDLVELNPFGTPYLTIVFPHDDWGDDSGNYASDFHLADDYYAEDQWVFQVKTDNPYRDINLYWSRPYLLEGVWTQDNGKRSWSKSKQADGGALFERMWLEDVLTGERIDAISESAVQNYQFNMGGSTVRTFRWVLDSHNGKSPKKPKKYPAAKGVERAMPPGLERMDQPPTPGKK